MAAIQDVRPRDRQPVGKQRLYQRVILNEVFERVKKHWSPHGHDDQLESRQFAFTAAKSRNHDQEVSEFLTRFK